MKVSGLETRQKYWLDSANYGNVWTKPVQIFCLTEKLHIKPDFFQAQITFRILLNWIQADL